MSNEPEPAVDARSQTPSTELMHYQTGISVPVVERPVPVTVVREEWVPEGMPAELSQQVRISPLYYAEHVGRAGVLAAALGVGAAIAGTTGVASAAPAKADSTTSSPSTTSVTKGSSAAENTAEANSRNAGPTKANTTETHSRTDRHTSNRVTHSQSETTATESAGVDTAVPTADQDTTTETTAPPATPAADTPSETAELPGAPSRDDAVPSTATDATTESTTDLSTAQVTLLPALPDEQSPVVDAAITTAAAPSSAAVATTAAESAPLISTVPTPAPVGAVGQVQETVLLPLASPTSQAGPTVQAAETPLLSKIFPWLRSTKTPTATTTSAQVVVPSSSAAVASSTATAVPTSVGINLPASATVLTIRGRGFGALTPDRMALSFGGIFQQASYKLTSLPYEQWGLTAITDGVKILDDAVMSTSGNIIVLAHSEGAEIATRWIRTYADDPVRAAMADRITFVLSGNPLRSGSGYAIGRWECDGVVGVGTPTDTPWATIDVARRWDGWADWPADTDNLWATAEATAGKTNSHMWYSKINLSDPQNTVYKVGNTTFVLTYESKLSILKKYRNAPADFVNAVRAEIEAGYNRPSTASTSATSQSAAIPAPVQIQSAQWQATFDSLVQKYGDPGGYSALA